MRRVYKIIRTVMLMLLALAFTVPAALYVALSFNSVQQSICKRVERELSNKLETKVSIGHISLSPFNKAALLNVSVLDSRGDTALTVKRLGAGISLRHLLRRKLVFNYAELLGMDVRIYRDSVGAPLNIQSIIDALSKKEPDKKPSQFDFRINTVVIRTSQVSYDVRNLPSTPGQFNRNHIYIRDLRADIRLPRIANDDFTIDLRSLALNEQSGFVLSHLGGKFHITPTTLDIEGLQLRLPHSTLTINNQRLNLSVLKNASKAKKNFTFDIDILEGSTIATTDLVAFLPTLDKLNLVTDITASISGTPNDIAIKSFHIKSSDNVYFCKLQGSIKGLTDSSDPDINIPDAEISANGAAIADFISRFTTLPPRATQILRNLGDTRALLSFAGTLHEATLTADIATAPGKIDIDGSFKIKSSRNVSFSGGVNADRFDCSRLLASIGHTMEQFGPTTLKAKVDISTINGSPHGEITADLPVITYRGYTYTNVYAHTDITGKSYMGEIDVNDPEVTLHLNAEANLDYAEKTVDFYLEAENVDLQALNLVSNTQGRLLTLNAEGSFNGPDIDHVNGYANINDISYTDSDGKRLRLDYIGMEALATADNKEINIKSDIATGTLKGKFSYIRVPRLCSEIVRNVVPNLLGAPTSSELYGDHTDKLSFDLTLIDSEPVEQIMKLPVKIIHPVNIHADLNSEIRTINLRIDAPYLQRGNKLIENTSLSMGLDGGTSPGTGRANLYATSLVTTKKGPLTLSLSAFGSDGQLDSQLAWHVNRETRYNGDINLTTRFSRNDENRLITSINVNPSEMIINDTTWKVAPAEITFSSDRLTINDFNIGRAGQNIAINGVASKSNTDVLTLTLNAIDLDYVFETLGIENAMFGGRATGDFYVSSAFSTHPVAYTPLLKVKNMKYNHSVMGDAEIESSWDPVKKAVVIDAQINQSNGGISYIDGKILPMADSLDFQFDADRIPIGFLKPFMSAFATDVKGFASGHARLWGTFKLIDMVGDVYGKDVSITLGFTNTTYTTTDSIHLRPGRIDIPGITLHDRNGNTARLSGQLTHKYFKAPSFNFKVTDARNLLVYDIPERKGERWFGTIYGNGGASVEGHPGFLKIGVNINTAPKSTFTFVLTDELQASDYNFITFRDRNATAQHPDSIAQPSKVELLKKRLANPNQNSSPTIYLMDINVDVNTNAQVSLIMDPVGGDKINSRGNGPMRLTYDSANEDLNLFGTYTLSSGSYNFTLQDIIIKDFSIEEGSKITFNGNPYAAQLDIKGAYSLNANLSDLDESFLQDKELNRTNVPVKAMLIVTGDMRQPDIHYDLAFPTLTSDIYRKVKSIVNTDEMMQRQIIYLLMLNRFYTPDYMTATKGNELVSVASSTISSQLGNMLGQLSDKFSISPNFRSDRGDFSDMEFDLALSSYLLNNRLLLNGNFGYRDKALNNNSFIGDFDIEYLLNRMGTIRLKAYNHYNDQNYYAKSALTTQGVGVVFKRDFDNVFSFLRPLLKRKKSVTTDTIAASDSTKVDVGRIEK